MNTLVCGATTMLALVLLAPAAASLPFVDELSPGAEAPGAAVEARPSQAQVHVELEGLVILESGPSGTAVHAEHDDGILLSGSTEETLTTLADPLLDAVGEVVVLLGEAVDGTDLLAPPADAPPAAPESASPPPVRPLVAAQEAAPASPLAGAQLVGLAFVAAAGAAAPAAGLGLERLRRIGVAVLLYSRIAKERLLDHGRRDALVMAIRQNPGIAMTDLARLVGAPRNTATYHLRMLEKEGLVTSLRNGRTRLFFPAGSTRQRNHAQALAALRHDTSRAMAQAIGEVPGLDQAALCARMNLTPSLAHWHADRLVEANLVTKVRQGRHVRYYPGEAFHLVNQAGGA